MPIKYGTGKSGRWRFSIYEQGTNDFLAGGTPRGFGDEDEAKRGLERLRRELLGQWYKPVAVIYGMMAGAAVCIVYAFFTFGG